MKIVQLRVESYKKIKAAVIRPYGDVNHLTGENGAGKSSAIDAIVTALGGKSRAPEDPVRHGDEVARITLDLGELVVKWHCRRGAKPVLAVESADGARYPSPQTMLDGLYGALTFDPMEFLRMDSRKQRATLADMTGLTGVVEQLTAERKALYDRRTRVNAEAERNRVLASAIPQESVQPVDTAETLAQLNEAQQRNAAVAEYQRSIRDAEMRVEQQRLQIKDYEARIAKLREAITAAEGRIAEEEGFIAKTSATMPETIDEQPLRDRIAAASEINARATRQLERETALSVAERLASESRELSDQMAEIDAMIKQRVADAPFPIEGLSLTEDGVLYNGVRFDQASTAEQMRVSCAIACAMNPTLKIMLVKNASLMSRKSYEALINNPALAGYQFWFEENDESGKKGFYLEDGEVVAINGVATTQEQNDE